MILIYLLVLVAATQASSDLEVNICEHNTNTISCDNGETIRILEANYGRTCKDTCPGQNSNTEDSCMAANSSNIVKEKCHNMQQCTLTASNSVFEDPCVGVYKYLYVKYKCAMASNVKDETVCEGSTMNLKCNTNEVIRIIQANYGRKSQSICSNPGLDSNVNCLSPTSAEIVSMRCNDRQECVIEATNALFGDPCVGTYKYLEIKYSCVTVIDCGPVATFSTCADMCPQTCPPVVLNSASCGCKPGCVCKDRYVKDIKTGKCMLPRNCPYYDPTRPNCSTPEKYDECRANTCQPSCGSHPAICAAMCEPGYMCKEGFVRDPENGRCMRREDCTCKG